MSEAIGHAETTQDQLSLVERILRENLYKSQEQALQSTLLFIAFTAAWELIRSAHVAKISLMNIELRDLGIALILLPPLSAFSYYRSQASIAFAALTGGALRTLYVEKMKPFAASDITELLDSPDFLSIENCLANIGTENTILKKVGNGWIIGLGTTLVLAPSVVLLWMCYILVRFPVTSVGWTLLGVLATLLLVVRSLILSVQAIQLIL
ncbi:MAG: hypothetical protein WB949_00595 [Candidatus Acidiferrales bacterium]